MIPEDLTPGRIAAALRTRWLGRSLRVLEEAGSTNDDARAAAEQGAVHGHLIVADRQRSGRGTHGRTWASPGGTDLYLSAVLRPALSLDRLPPLTLAAGLGVAETAEVLSGVEARVKWPNDVWLAGRKCAGILVETFTVARGPSPRLAPSPPAVTGDHAVAVLGIGLNVNRRDFAELRDRATSLALAGAGSLDRTTALAALLLRVEHWVDRFLDEGSEAVMDALTQRLLFVGAHVRCGDASGILLGLAPDGALRLQGPDGVVRPVRAGTLESP